MKMEVIKSAGVYNCHIDDLYKSAEPAEAQSTHWAQRSCLPTCLARGKGWWVQDTALGHPPHPYGSAHRRGHHHNLLLHKRLPPIAPTGSKSSRTLHPLHHLQPHAGYYRISCDCRRVKRGPQAWRSPAVDIVGGSLQLL